ncbi:serine/threonine protein kinase [Rhodopirellula sallentina]|uniref:Serine/threonine protein kinase n=1 Tax=Rhodopirellula sallentina SM41 TaxID=1263870 RepID=M5TY37_9BACT|nr:serine/threonine-protein kinase [Rhodopirellula sallentina]EMI54132.1 serine/threonine protein kinase [Rhodopirellula sallentina SM41]
MSFLDSLRGMFSSSGPTLKKIDVDSRFARSRTAATGTMSNFFVAYDIERKEDVGVKILDPEKFELFEARFKGLNKPMEGEIALQMNHDLIVKTYEHGVTSKGERIIVMEYIRGPSMQDIIVRKRLELIDGMQMQLMREMAEALTYVHRSGFIHRDVCPRNFICTLPTEDQKVVSGVKLIDFGLTVPATPPFMAPGNRTGTPLYMSPEIVRRRSTDSRVDVFSLGVTFYCLLTFSHPWQGEVVTGRAALQHDTTEPTDLLERCDRIDPRLARVIMKMIQPNVDNRLKSIDEFLNLTHKVENAFVS